MILLIIFIIIGNKIDEIRLENDLEYCDYQETCMLIDLYNMKGYKKFLTKERLEQIKKENQFYIDKFNLTHKHTFEEMQQREKIYEEKERKKLK
jgi:hypothetical protein